MNINNFLTPKSKPFYDHIIGIIQKLNEYQQKVELWKLPDNLQCNIVIFGGFIRDLIRHYFEYQNNEDVEFIKPKDIDTWFHYKSPMDDEYHKFSHSMTSWIRYLRALNEIMRYNSEYDVNHYLSGYSFSVDITKYCVCTMEIDEINFDMCTDINNYSGKAFTTFKNLSDFTVNNLYIDINGQLNKRDDCSDYTLDICIDDIKNKKLHNIYIVPNEEEYSMINFFDKREKKMLEYGYVY